MVEWHVFVRKAEVSLLTMCHKRGYSCGSPGIEGFLSVRRRSGVGFDGAAVVLEGVLVVMGVTIVVVGVVVAVGC